MANKLEFEEIGLVLKSILAISRPAAGLFVTILIRRRERGPARSARAVKLER
jgi:hypothetical protein